MKSRVKVTVSGLIEAIEARKQAEIASHTARTAELPERLEAWKAECLQILQAATERVAAGETPGKPTDRYDSPTTLRFPERPTVRATPDVDHFDRALARLKLAADETILISDDDYGMYVR